MAYHYVSFYDKNPFISRANLMDSAALFFSYLPSLVSCGELFITKLHLERLMDSSTARCWQDVCVLKVTFIQETFPPIIIHNHDSVENGGGQTVQVDFSVSWGSFSTSRVKTPWHHTSATCWWESQGCLVCTFITKGALKSGVNCWVAA